jgi:hypothetical protein
MDAAVTLAYGLTHSGYQLEPIRGELSLRRSHVTVGHPSRASPLSPDIAFHVV